MIGYLTKCQSTEGTKMALYNINEKAPYWTSALEYCSHISEKFKYAESRLGIGKYLTAYSLLHPICRRMEIRQLSCKLSGIPINRKQKSTSAQC